MPLASNSSNSVMDTVFPLSVKCPRRGRQERHLGLKGMAVVTLAIANCLCRVDNS